MSVRFAPSPTGSFHLGNLRTAWISYRWARKLGVPWWVRFEDIDQPRVLEGAMESQLEDMRALGLVPDRVTIQSASFERHWAVFEEARRAGRVYPCFCSRKEIQAALAEAASAPHSEVPVYHGHCRDLAEYPETRNPTLAWRFRHPEGLGEKDFIVARSAGAEPDRASFVPAYNWACAVDDYDGDPVLVVRAWDLEHVLGQQREVHRLLCELERPKPLPAVFHASLVVQDDGHRLEKRTRGVTLPELLARGLTAESIVEVFARSYSQPGESLPPGAVSGEPSKQLTLSQLGLI